MRFVCLTLMLLIFNVLVASNPGNERNPYEVLGLDFHATQSEISSKFRQLSRLYHPDKSKNHNREQNKKMYIQIQNAYEDIKAHNFDSLHFRPQSQSKDYDADDFDYDINQFFTGQKMYGSFVYEDYSKYFTLRDGQNKDQQKKPFNLYDFSARFFDWAFKDTSRIIGALLLSFGIFLLINRQQNRQQKNQSQDIKKEIQISKLSTSSDYSHEQKNRSFPQKIMQLENQTECIKIQIERFFKGQLTSLKFE